MCNVTLRRVHTTIVQWITISITYSQCVFVALGIQHAMHVRHVAICDLSGSRVFFSHYLINGTILWKK